MNEPTQDLWRNLKRPLVAILLGVLPFWLFLGASERRKVNGEVVFESDLNLLGVGMAIIALGLAFTMLRRDGSPGQPQRWWPRTLLVIAAIPLALFQLGYSIGFYSFKDIEIAVFGRPAPPPPDYAGLAPDVKKSVAERSKTQDQGHLHDDIVNTLLRMTEARSRHNAYATACYRGQWQMAETALPGMLGEAGRSQIAERVRSLASEPASPCTPNNARLYITKLSEAYSHDADILAILVAAYEGRFGTAPAAQIVPATPPAIEGVPVTVDASMEEAQRAFGTTSPPQPYTSAGGERLALYPGKGFALYLSDDKKVETIRLDAPFEGKVGGVRIGDSLITLKRLMGEPVGEPFPGTGLDTLAYLYHLPGGITARFDTSAGDGVQAILLFKTN
ncbi:hypothetical protein J8I29_21105 [Labrys sp. LIt4]|uniref:hypothetical protein n=1 Tax=Labrys sp. LIt4 TaxID=2821355 RepID=UPI001AE0200E|nr:hypothetical protein [Labrys sp. LIt4]MBP0581841.1 hypothetical protein [Labrys sp. LIt4]